VDFLFSLEHGNELLHLPGPRFRLGQGAGGEPGPPLLTNSPGERCDRGKSRDLAANRH